MSLLFQLRKLSDPPGPVLCLRGHNRGQVPAGDDGLGGRNRPRGALLPQRCPERGLPYGAQELRRRSGQPTNRGSDAALLPDGLLAVPVGLILSKYKGYECNNDFLLVLFC